MGRYGVDVPGFERFLETTDILRTDAGIIIIDEIGKMECFSARFRDLVIKALAGATPVVATIAAKGGGFIARAKERPDVELIEVTHANRDTLPSDLAGRFA